MAQTGVLVENDGFPVAVVISRQEFDRLDRLDAEWGVLDEIGAALRDVDPVGIERETARAIAEVRAETRAERAAQDRRRSRPRSMPAPSPLGSRAPIGATAPPESRHDSGNAAPSRAACRRVARIEASGRREHRRSSDRRAQQVAPLPALAPVDAFASRYTS